MSEPDLLAEARAIGDEFVKGMVRVGDRGTWVARVLPEVLGPGGRAKPVVRTMGPKIYDGAAGVALFLGRLALVTRSPEYADAAAAGIRYAVDRVLEGEGAKEEGRFGFYSGDLGVAWAATELAPLVGEPMLFAKAQAIVRALGKTLDAPRAHDLIFGAAGGIPTLLDLHRKRVEGARDLAIELGRDLVAAAEWEGDTASWPRMRPEWYRNLTGFSHGTAGFAWGLGELYAATGEEKFAEVARAAVRYERAHFAPALGNWPDFRQAVKDPSAPATSVIWCHGAPGIGLSRVLMMRVLGDEQMREEARIAAETTKRGLDDMMDLPGSNFMLCHGVAGNAETLWLIREGLGVPGAHAEAVAVARSGVRRFGAQARERWGTRFVSWPTGMPGARERSLMKGVAGVGYFLLRAHSPELVPTVLVPGRSWERSKEGSA